MKTRKKISFEVLVVIEKDGDEFYAHCPSLKGLHTSGKTKPEIMINAANAIVAYIESLIKHGDPIPYASLTRIPIEERVCQWAENYYRWIRKEMITEKEFSDSLVDGVKGMINNVKREDL